MADSDLYFGPYNDPGDTNLLFHWKGGHDPDCHNPAFTVDRTGQSINIVLALRNRRPADTPSGVLVNLYAAACGLFSSVTDVNDLVGRVLENGGKIASANPDLVSTYVQEWSGLPQDNNEPVVFPFQSGSDNPWLSEVITWPVPAFTNSYVLVATVSSSSYSVGPDPLNAYTRDPCVAVWLG